MNSSPTTTRTSNSPLFTLTGHTRCRTVFTGRWASSVLAIEGSSQPTPTPAAANASEAARITQSARRRRIHEDDAGDARLVPLAPCSPRGGRRHGRGGLPLVAVALAAALGLSSAALAIVLVARRI